MSYSQYSLVQKALQDREQLMTVDAKLNAITERTLEILDTQLKSPAAEKEALMTVAVLSLTSPAIFDNWDNFDKQYNQRVKDLSQEIFSRSTPSAEMIQLGMAQTIAAVESTVNRVGRDAYELQVMRDSIESTFSNLRSAANAPQLVSLLDQTAYKIEAALDEEARRPTGVPRSPHAGKGRETFVPRTPHSPGKGSGTNVPRKPRSPGKGGDTFKL